jgi:choline dehydrogenase
MAIDVVVDLPGVGANLADHPGTDFDTGWRGTAWNHGPLHSIATFRSSSTPARSAPDLMFWITDPDSDDAGFYLDPILLKPRARGRVRLRSLDPSDAPRITLPVPDAWDLARLAEGYRRALEIANRPEFRRLASEPAPPEPPDDIELRSRILEHAYSIPHVVGTSRMGPSPADGDVVDHLGRVHGVRGLSVIDASVVPEPPSGFPHLITLMLAEHLAERITGMI